MKISERAHSDLPLIIQGGMSAGVSAWELCKEVSKLGHLGVLGGTALHLLCGAYLQLGDKDGQYRRALEHFPDKNLVDLVIDKFYVPGGKKPEELYPQVLKPTLSTSNFWKKLAVLGNFVEVWLAKESHNGLIGINYLEKLKMPHLTAIYGAMLAGVDYIIVGAGIPFYFPGIIESYSQNKPASMVVDVIGSDNPEDGRIVFDPAEEFGFEMKITKKPKFLTIISSAVLAKAMMTKASGPVDGFVIEGNTAGGHNAPPRGKMQLNDKGEPIYSEKDETDLEIMRSLKLPFWLAGGYGHPHKLKEALALGATGIQAGTAFALTKESKLTSRIKNDCIDGIRNDTLETLTDPLASPAGYPFKMTSLEYSVANQKTYEDRKRICDLGFVSQVYKRQDGSLGYRCPSEPIEVYVSKGGARNDTIGRKCICNGLAANVGIGLTRKNGYAEPPMVCLGKDIANLKPIIKPDSNEITAKEVIEYIVGDLEE